MKKIILNYNPVDSQVLDDKGTYIGTLASEPELYEDQDSSAEIVLKLVKQGVTAEEIIKLRNADLL